MKGMEDGSHQWNAIKGDGTLLFRGGEEGHEEDGGAAKGWNGMKEHRAVLYLGAEDEDGGDSQSMECYEGGWNDAVQWRRKRL